MSHGLCHAWRPAQAAEADAGPGAKRKWARFGRAPARKEARAPGEGRQVTRPRLNPGAPGSRPVRSAAATLLRRPPPPADTRIQTKSVARCPEPPTRPRGRATPPDRDWERTRVSRVSKCIGHKGRAGFLGINDQTQGALFSPSPPSSPPQEQEKEKSVENAPPLPLLLLLSPT